MCACSFALVQALPAQRSASSLDGDLQHARSGHRDRVRLVVSRPLNHFACAKGTPMVIENSSSGPVPVWHDSQKVPSGVSVYW
jgi:hypothetical protein